MKGIEMYSLAPSRTVNLTHNNTGRIVTARVTQDMFVEPVAGFDASFTWRAHREHVEAALLAEDCTDFQPWPDEIVVPT